MAVHAVTSRVGCIVYHPVIDDRAGERKKPVYYTKASKKINTYQDIPTCQWHITWLIQIQKPVSFETLKNRVKLFDLEVFNLV